MRAQGPRDAAWRSPLVTRSRAVGACSQPLLLDEEHSSMRETRTYVLSCIISLLAGGSAAWAQSTGTVRGRVIGPTGDPLSGASVLVSGSQRGAVARTDGSYQLTLPAGKYELRARLIGYAESVDSV